MDIAKRLQELAECGAYGELCAEARAYLALDAERQDEDTAYMARVRLGETLLTLSQSPSMPKAMRRACAF